ncbi:hypothetical protein RMSM_05392 [Rhodopirellula maiorica SM1]|uniref:Uncharacterized protein n=1 Tax=Rhodopirellula maiorica SM1 TaxID=1265738 RepID=M5RE85_9BACT|nr:hypothetical protein RMSM_05392 [Rhodopirellula maiorica SM1]
MATHFFTVSSIAKPPEFAGKQWQSVPVLQILGLLLLLLPNKLSLRDRASRYYRYNPNCSLANRFDPEWVLGGQRENNSV